MEKTTIQINGSTLQRLKMFKRYSRESYDEILNNLINETEEETLDENEIKEIQDALEEVRKGKTYSIDEVAKELKVILE